MLRPKIPQRTVKVYIHLYMGINKDLMHNFTGIGKLMTNQSSSQFSTFDYF